MRRPTPEDTSVIVEALFKFKRLAEQNPLFGSVDTTKALEFIWGQVDGGNAWIADGYLIIAIATKPWYNNDRMLVEQLVVKLDHSGVIASVPAALEAIAKELGCNKVLASDSSRSGTYHRACELAGFIPYSPILYKAIPCAES